MGAQGQVLVGQVVPATVVAPGRQQQASYGAQQGAPASPEVSFAQRLENAANTIQLTNEMVQTSDAPASVKRSLHREMTGELQRHLAFLQSAVETPGLSEAHMMQANLGTATAL